MPVAVFGFTMPRLTLTAIVDILAVAAVIYQLLQIVRGTRAAHILTGIVAVVVVYRVSVIAHLDALRSLLSSLAPYTAIAIIVLFQSEIRRTLARLGRKRIFGGSQRRESTDEILLALSAMSRDSTGALIVLERDIGLRTFVESGVPLDAQLSRDLILSIFQPGNALHDGAIIIQKDRIAAAACFLPLTVNPTISVQTRPATAAAIGITEETDCLALIVSEETGAISVAAFGAIESAVPIERVDERINQHFGGVRRKPPEPPATSRKRSSGSEDARLIGFFTKNIWWKLLSLVAGFFIWMEVASEPELATVVATPVEYKNFPKDLEISSNIIDSVEVEARGASGLLRELTSSRVAAIVDFSDVKGPGERTITLTRAQLNLPQGIALMRIMPAQLRFKFEKRMAKMLPVHVPYSGTLPAGLAIESVEVIPPTLTVAGPGKPGGVGQPGDHGSLRPHSLNW